MYDQERENALFCPPPPEDTIRNQTSSSRKFNCELCKHESKSAAALYGHLYLKHNCFIPHTSKWNQNKCHIKFCNNGLVFTQTVDFKCHMIKQHGFSDDSDNCMKCEGTEIGLYRPGISYRHHRHACVKLFGMG